MGDLIGGIPLAQQSQARATLASVLLAIRYYADVSARYDELLEARDTHLPCALCTTTYDCPDLTSILRRSEVASIDQMRTLGWLRTVANWRP